MQFRFGRVDADAGAAARGRHGDARRSCAAGRRPRPAAVPENDCPASCARNSSVRAARSNSSIPRSIASAPLLGLDRARIGLVDEHELAGVVACPDRGGQRLDQRAHGGGVVDLLLVARAELGQLVFDAAHLAQPQDRAPADDVALGFDDAAGKCRHRHGEADAARAQGVDRTLHVARARRARARCRRRARGVARRRRSPASDRR